MAVAPTTIIVMVAMSPDCFKFNSSLKAFTRYLTLV
jgi:hypothetical protein